MLFELNSVEDLFCRGFTQAQILENVGVDIGYHGSKIRDIIKNVNRHDYYVEFVRVVSGMVRFRQKMCIMRLVWVIWLPG